MKVILDTNFLVYCALQKIDYVEQIGVITNQEAELIVSQQAVNELKSLEKGAQKLLDRRAAGLALKLLKFNRIPIVPAKGQSGDDAALFMARFGAIVATSDRALQRKVRKTIVIEGKRKIVFG